MGQDNWKKIPMPSVIVGANGKMSFFCGSFMLFSVLCLLCIYARLFICALWSPAGKGLPSWLWFVVFTVNLSLSQWYTGSDMDVTS